MVTIKRMLVTLLVIGSHTLTGCVTTGDSKKTANTKKSSVNSDKKTGSKASPPKPQAPRSVAAITNDPNPGATIDFVVRNMIPNAVISSDDVQYWTNLPSPPAPNTAHEAALIIGAVKITGALGSSGSFQEADLQSNAADNSEQNASTKSLDQICKDRNISLVEALKSNPLLASSAVFAMVQQALQRGNNPETLSTSVKQIIQMQFEAWRRLAGSSEEPKLLSETDDEGGTRNTPSPTTDVSTASMSATDLKNADNILMEAQILADQKLYSAALAKVGQIGRDSPLYSEAQERSKTFSNGAVQELRQKAALAYQNSIPMSDKEAKENLLKQAKAHLEEAISNYPNSDQIGTVKENLLTIDRELSQLKY